MQTKDVQGKLWSTAPAHWAKYLEPTFIPMYKSVLKSIPVNEDTMLLDAGCGSGLFLGMAKAKGAIVHGIDAAPGMLSVARKRLPGTTLLIEDLESLPFGDNAFDVVTGFNSFQYSGSFERVIAEAARVTKKKGKVVIGIWGKENNCEASDVLKAVLQLMPPPPPGTPGPFALSEEGKVDAICENAGLMVITKKTVQGPWQFSGVDVLQKAFMCTGPCVKAANVVGEQKVREVIVESAQPFNMTDDIYYMKNEFMYFIAEKL